MPKHITTLEVAEGHGSPAGVVSGLAGLTYRDLDGGQGNTFWEKTYGPGTGGWKAVDDPTLSVSIPSGAALPGLTSVIGGNPFLETTDHHLYVLQGTANSSFEDEFGRYPSSTPLAGGTTLSGNAVYIGNALAINNHLVSGQAMINLGAPVTHEVSFNLDPEVGPTIVGNDMVTVYLGSDGTAGSAIGYAVTIGRTGTWSVANGATVVATGVTGASMWGVDVTVSLQPTGVITVLRAGVTVAVFGPPVTVPTFGNFVGISVALVNAPGLIHWSGSSIGSLTWFRVEAVPQGGTQGQVLAKNSVSDFDLHWIDPPVIFPTGINTLRAGTTAPDPTLGQNGDFYVHYNTGIFEVYGPKSGGAWGSSTSLIGPTGATGAAGTNGTNGTNGLSVLSGNGAPAGGLGVVTQVYIDTTNWVGYVKTGTSTWSAGVSLKGPQGIQGIQGAQGNPGVQGNPGSNGSNGSNGASGAGLIPGAIMMWAGQTGPPTGFLICDGSPVSRTTYGPLFAAIGTFFGAGDNVSTFNLPDMRGNFPQGVAANPGLEGGSDAHTHTLGDAGQAAITLSAVSTPQPMVAMRRITLSPAAGKPTPVDDIGIVGPQLSMTNAGNAPMTAGAALTGSTDEYDGYPPFLQLVFLIKT